MIQEKLEECLGGRGDAFHFCVAWLDLVAFYDDLIDRDNPLSDSDIHHGMWCALVAMPRNPFYRQYFDVLNPLVMNSISSWRVANKMESISEDLNISFIIRSSYADIVQMCALLLHGQSAAEQAGYAMRKFVHSEDFEEYKLEFKGA